MSSGLETHNERLDDRVLLDQIADKWSILILSTICQGPMRFNALKRSLSGVSQKSLTQALRRLERNGILKREVISTYPVAVEYRITPLGKTLKEPFLALFGWVHEHAAEVEQARIEFDQRQREH